MRQLLLVIWLIWGITNPGWSQAIDESQFQLYTTREGLSDNVITGLGQDSTGFIWIGTRHGLNRFDGHIFKQLLHTASPYSIPDNSIFSMKFLPDNELAIATDDGAQIISASTLQAKNLDIPTDDELRYWSNASKYVSKDRDGNYGVSTKTGFYIFSSEGKLKKRYDYYTVRDIGHSWMLFGRSIHVMPDGNMMQENSAGFAIYDRNKSQVVNAVDFLKPVRSTLEQLKQTKDCIFFLSAGYFLVLNSTTNNFDIVDIHNGQVKSFPSPIDLTEETGWQTTPALLDDSTLAINSKKKGFFLLKIGPQTLKITCNSQRYFGDYLCTSIFRDRNKRMWIGTSKGLFMENLKLPIIHSFVAAKEQEPLFIRALYTLADRIFAASGNKIFVLDKYTHKIHTSFPVQGLPETGMIGSFLHLKEDTVWIATSTGLFWLNQKNYRSGRIPDNNIFNEDVRALLMFKDRSGKIWISAETINTVYVYDQKRRTFDSITHKENPLLAINIANSIAEDKEGNIWLGGDAICRWNRQLKKVDTLIRQLSGQRNRKKGFSVMSDEQGEIWVLVNDDGMARITGNNFTHLRPDNLNRDLSIVAYPAILDDKMLMPVYNGIGYLDIKKQKSVIFTQSDGMPNLPVSTYFFSRDPADRSIWFACANVICQLPFYRDPNYLLPPRLRFTELTILNDTAFNYPLSPVSLKHDQNDLKLSLGVINFTDPQNMLFAYRFRNKKDSFWIELGNQQDILLSNMSPGMYTVEVKAYAYDNKWPAQFKLMDIYIKPPFWKSTWFFVLLGFLLAAFIFLAYRIRIRQINQKANLDKLLAQTEMKALHAQMNPHFIFNCLNSIREMILENENRQASHYLSKFAHLIRITLHQSSRQFMSLQDTIDYLRRYLEMEQIRSTHFSYQIDVDESLNPAEIMLPPMLIQPFIENAIWHGSSTRKEPLDLKIFFVSKNDQLLCCVDDNGIGIEASLMKKKESDQEHHSVGIANIRQRLQVLNEKYNMHCSLAIEDKCRKPAYKETGTIVTLSFPIKYD